MSEVSLPLGREFRCGSLRSLRENDATSMLSWMHEPAIATVFARDFMSVTEDMALSFIRASWDNVVSANLAIAGSDDAYLGTVSLKNIDTETGTAEYAIALTASARGTGAALMGTRDVLRLAFEGFGLNRVWLCVRPSNKRAIRFYEKVGFQRRDSTDLNTADELLYFEISAGVCDAKG